MKRIEIDLLHQVLFGSVPADLYDAYGTGKAVYFGKDNNVFQREARAVFYTGPSSDDELDLPHGWPGMSRGLDRVLGERP